MAWLSNRAIQQAEALGHHYGSKGREEAVSNLRRAIIEASAKADDPAVSTRAYPSSYRDIALLGFRWLKVGHYWFAIDATAEGNVIAHIFYDRADIPSRIMQD